MGRCMPPPSPVEKQTAQPIVAPSRHLGNPSNKTALFLPAQPTGKLTCQCQTSIQSAFYCFTLKCLPDAYQNLPTFKESLQQKAQRQK